MARSTTTCSSINIIRINIESVSCCVMFRAGARDPILPLCYRILQPEPRTSAVRGDIVGRNVRAGNPHHCILPPRCPVGEIGEGRVQPPKPLNVAAFNVRGCSTNSYFIMDFLKNNVLFYLSISCVCCSLFVELLSQIQAQILIGGFGYSILIFVVFMPIWTSWLWLDRIMRFWFVASLKSLIAAISQSSVSLALVAPNTG